MALRLARSRLLTHFLRRKIEGFDGVPLSILAPIGIPSSLVDSNDTCRGGSLGITSNFCSIPHAGSVAADEILTIDDKGSTSEVQIKLLMLF
jgi:hypothetical protein